MKLKDVSLIFCLISVMGIAAYAILENSIWYYHAAYSAQCLAFICHMLDENKKDN
jgi:hypothetical protein